MRKSERNDVSTQPIWPQQVITLHDLALFKIQLLHEIKALFQAQPQRTETSQWIKSSEVQKLLKVSRGKLFSLRADGKLPFSRIGGVIYYKRNDIEQMLDANREGV